MGNFILGAALHANFKIHRFLNPFSFPDFNSSISGTMIEANEKLEFLPNLEELVETLTRRFAHTRKHYINIRIIEIFIDRDYSFLRFHH